LGGLGFGGIVSHFVSQRIDRKIVRMSEQSEISRLVPALSALACVMAEIMAERLQKIEKTEHQRIK
jgi:hypothetical protein